jgi:uncharacterized protein (DUF1800 family)
MPMRLLVPLALALLLAACGGGGGGGGGDSTAAPPTPAPAPPAPSSNIFETPASVSRFLATASFGARPGDLESLRGSDASAWFVDQLEEPVTLTLPYVEDFISEARTQDQGFGFRFIAPTMAFWRNAVEGSDQLRQRMTFALSQIMVVSDANAALLRNVPQAMAYYRDVLARNALGNFRTLLEEVTYSPAMAYYLTYLGNLPADPATGRQPDENYAREVMQLFTIGLLELNADGTPVLDADGEPIETYTNEDIDGLARVFTGMDIESGDAYRDPQVAAQPLIVDDSRHSTLEKSFLGTTIPANTPGEESISRALDTLFEHPNVGPFIGRQLIQRFTSSDPSPAYVARVAGAFDSGEYVLPDETRVGEGRRGDLAATLAAVLFDAEARQEQAGLSDRFGKPREPVLRFLQWARAFDVDGSNPELAPILYDTSSANALAQHPYRARSVFNFYRPGFIAPGTDSGSLGMTVPELQIVNASSTPGYVNFLSYFIFGAARDFESEVFLRQFFDGTRFLDDADSRARQVFVADYAAELELADDPEALVEHLDVLLAHGALRRATKDGIIELIDAVPLEEEDSDQDDENRAFRVYFAVLMIMTAPEYLVQR